MKNKIVLVTGGTGSLGQALVEQLLALNLKKIIVFSRDEYKQYQMRNQIEDPDKRIRYFIGDVRDRDRLERAFKGVDYVIHCAALKHVAVAEYNPTEVIQTNVLGTQNVVDAAIDQEVSKVLGVSSDKAVNPISLYGATKLCADKLFLAGGVYGDTIFSVIRFGNFQDSRGSVMPFWKELNKQGGRKIPITDKRMTRFWISLDHAAEKCIEALDVMKGGEIFIPEMKSMSLLDVAKEMNLEKDLEEIGMGRGEKLHEELLTKYDRPFDGNPGGYVLLGKKSKVVLSSSKMEE